MAVLPYDEPAARTAGSVLAHLAGSGGGPDGPSDAQIAGLALTGGHPVATRDVRRFAGTGVPVIDPWAGSGTRT